MEKQKEKKDERDEGLLMSLGVILEKNKEAGRTPPRPKKPKKQRRKKKPRERGKRKPRTACDGGVPGGKGGV